MDGSPLEDGCELTLYKYPHMELIGKTRTVRHEVRAGLQSLITVLAAPHLT